MSAWEMLRNPPAMAHPSIEVEEESGRDAVRNLLPRGKTAPTANHPTTQVQISVTAWKTARQL